MSRSNRALLRCVCGVLCLLLAGPAGSRGEEGPWDPPAIKVWPSHGRVAADPTLVPGLIEQGRLLFEARFNTLDGAGRPAATGDSKPTPRSRAHDRGLLRTSGPDAMACDSCHNQPAPGGSGDFVANAFVGAHFADPPTHRVDTEVTSERNTISVFGAGLIEILAGEMTAELRAQRSRAAERAAATGAEVATPLTAKGVSFGSIVVRPDGTADASRLEGVDYDLIVRPFGSKGVAASIREFTIAALNQHHGIQAIERFGWERTGRRDFDEDGVEVEFTVGQLSALVAFQAALPAPRRTGSLDPAQQQAELLGARLFDQVGCASCHIPSLAIATPVFSEPNRYNRPGAITPKDVPLIQIGLGEPTDGGFAVEAYTDLKRHNLCDDEIRHFCNERLRQDNVATELFLTAKLWDLATSAPYGHRGDLLTLSDAILQHGGEARPSRDRFLALTDLEKRAVVAFLLSLGRSPRCPLERCQPNSQIGNASTCQSPGTVTSDAYRPSRPKEDLR